MGKFNLIIFFIGTALLTIGYSNCNGYDASQPMAANNSQTSLPPSPVPNPVPPQPVGPTFTMIEANILAPKCVSCHGPNQQQAGVRLDMYAEAKLLSNVNSPAMSLLYTDVQSGRMPTAPNPPLSALEVSMILQWIQAGALNN